MNIPVWVGTRYAMTGSVNRYMSLVSWISLLGMMLGVIALIVVVSVMNGFDRELKQRILGVIPHVVVEGDVDPSQLVHPLIQELVPFSQAQGMVVKAGESRLVAVFGIDSEGEADRLGSHLVAGTLPDFGENNQGQVALGRSLGLQLGLGLDQAGAGARARGERTPGRAGRSRPAGRISGWTGTRPTRRQRGGALLHAAQVVLQVAYPQSQCAN